MLKSQNFGFSCNLIFKVHIEYTAAALFEEFYAVDGVNKAVSPDPFYRFIDDVVFTPFDFDAERAKISDETESNYYLSRCLKLTRQRHWSNSPDLFSHSESDNL